MYLLDTNILIYYFRDEGEVAGKLLSKLPSEVAIPSIVIYELERGIAKSTSPRKRARQLESLVESIQVLPFGSQEAKAAARISRDLELAGMSISPFDTLIAGTALSNKAILVTNNQKEFARVKGLRLENWYTL